ncbi:MAG: hypothetical protein K9L32_07905 [Chromatiaceae bacterium]|jgi:predicted DNA-binding protein|uniref:hypothetical protein n=1 Tax=Lamprobacter modestohalophilus TaxID=1064514 RepID=UPI001908825E|nr:hypothetical protein [Lamprobacter modestohalophilus]MCF8004114.1 hypothetical protein [Chromatiaceae bacterium]
MTNLSVQIPDQAATALAGLARSRGQTPEQVVAALVEHYLEDAEDLADATMTIRCLPGGEEPYLSAVSDTLGEWNSAEDEEAWREL